LPPFFSWSPRLADALNSDLTALLDHVGPVGGGIGGDWRHWRNGAEPETCADEYFNEIQRVGKGIIVMHDSIGDTDVERQKVRTLELVQILVPKLLEQGYSFVREPLTLTKAQVKHRLGGRSTRSKARTGTSPIALR
jgi:hypothetical protein